jgi:hemerythrin superfamily protein
VADRNPEIRLEKDHIMQKSSAKPRTKDAITLLKADHRTVEKLFKQYETLAEKGGSHARKEKLAEKICNELKVHTQIEEEIFYPGVHGAIEEDLLKEAVVEHASAKELISQIESMDAGDELFDAKVQVLAEYIIHHVQEEETEMFPKVKEAEVDTKTLGARMQGLKEVLKSEQDSTITRVVNSARKAVKAIVSHTH